MKCQLWNCDSEAEYQNKNGVCACEYHKLLLDAFNWELRNKRVWIPLVTAGCIASVKQGNATESLKE
jgi:hypothetical protein